MGLNQVVLISKELKTHYFMDMLSFIKVTQEVVVFLKKKKQTAISFLEHYTVKLIKLFYVVL